MPSSTAACVTSAMASADRETGTSQGSKVINICEVLHRQDVAVTCIQVRTALDHVDWDMNAPSNPQIGEIGCSIYQFVIHLLVLDGAAIILTLARAIVLLLAPQNVFCRRKIPLVPDDSSPFKDSKLSLSKYKGIEFGKRQSEEGVLAVILFKILISILASTHWLDICRKNKCCVHNPLMGCPIFKFQIGHRRISSE